MLTQVLAEVGKRKVDLLVVRSSGVLNSDDQLNNIR